MNYLAHLYLAKPNADSHFGNLLGDFGGKRHARTLSTSIQQGLANHYLVDKFTDHHPLVKQAKTLFSPQRKRFSGIAIDVLFDHFLISHWAAFNRSPFNHFKRNSYRLLDEKLSDMPDGMQRVVSSITTNDWFSEYKTVEGIGAALDNIVKRIRFKNSFSGAIEDILVHYDSLEATFLEFFPELIAHVEQHGLEE